MDKNNDINGKVAIVTGGGGALGGAAALNLTLLGVKVVLLGRKEESLAVKADQIKNEGGEVIYYPSDVLSEEQMTEVKEKVLEKYGRIDILLNAAGGNMPGATIPEDKTIFDLKMEDFNKVTNLNLNGTVVPSIVFAKAMADQNSGCIVNYSSMAVSGVITRVVGYSASKAGMENFTRWMAVEMARKYGDKIRVNAVAPGFFIGNQNKRLLLNEDGSLTSRGKSIIQNTPMGRFGEAEELNGAIEFLSSDASKFVTGVVIPVDGGFSVFSGV